MNKQMNFKKYLKSLEEETTSGDIATVDNVLDNKPVRNKHLVKGKKCTKHKRYNCNECEDLQESKWN